MKKKRGIIFIILAVVAIAVIFAVAVLNSNLKQLADLTIEDINLSAIADGTYNGSYRSFPVSAEVKVTVKNDKITAIELVKHNHGQGAAAEIIPEKVVEAQTLAVDTVTGATYSSKVILKAIENAFK